VSHGERNGDQTCLSASNVVKTIPCEAGIVDLHESLLNDKPTALPLKQLM